MATGWNEVITVRSKGERIVAAEPATTPAAVPVRRLGHPIRTAASSSTTTWPNGAWTTRSPSPAAGPSRSNDQAHVEQKNFSIVRRNVGYYRYDNPRELDLLNQLWLAESTIGNLFTANQKLISKTRTGARFQETRPRRQPADPAPARSPRPARPPRRPRPDQPPRHHRPVGPPRADPLAPSQPHRLRQTPHHPQPARQTQPRLPLPHENDPSHAGISG